MEVEGSWTEVFECSEGKQARGEDELLGSSTLTLAPLLPRPPPAQRSQPLVITKSRTKGSRPLTSSVPSIPNPFPELCSPSQSPVLIGSHSPQSSNTHLVKVCGEDSHSRCLWVSAGATVREVCDILVQTAHCSDQKNWALVELHQSLGLERCLEDHEVVQEVQARWNPEGDTKLVFRKNYAKYEFFRKPTQFFPQNMISDSADVTKGMTSSELIQNMPGACPEIQGFLHMKERSRKTWKRIFFFLRRSGLYFSIKGSSKEPRHLQCIDELKNLNVYTITNSCKLYGAPVDFTFCVKPCKDGFRAQNLTLLCAENEQTRTCWVSAFRLFKYGSQLQQNFQRSQSAPQSPEVTLCTDTKAGQRSESEDSLVAMDFSGKAGGRVIQNPREAQSAEREEGQAWRRREALRYSLPNPSLGSCPSSIHRTQPWFHGGVSRREAEKLIEEQGHVDGMFLIRESQQHSQCFVLSLCHKLKTKHYLIIPCDEGGRNYYTMTDGETLFIDLLQLVEFHQINKGSLPVCLKHPCVCVAL